MIISHVPLYLVPLAAALGAAALILGGELARRARVGLVALLSSLALLASASGPLFRHETPFTAGPRVARMGSLDATLSLSLTPVTAILAALALLGAAAHVARSSSAARTRAHDAAVVGLASSVTLAALADGYPALVGGLLGFGLMLAALVGAESRRAGGRVLSGVLLASIGLSVAAAVSFWALGGKFLDGRRYLSDFQPRFVAVSDAPDLPEPRASRPTPADLSHLTPTASGELTMTTHPGARVYLGIADEGQLTGRAPDVVSPFVGFKVRSGIQKIAIDPGGGALVGGDGQEVALVDDVRFPPDSHVTIEAVGPTVTFSEIARQLGEREGSIETRTLGPLRLLDLARAALLLGLALLALATGSSGAAPTSRALGGIGAIVIAGTIRDRLGALFHDAGALPMLIAVAAAALALAYAVLASRSVSASALASRGSGWLAAASVVAVSFGAPLGSAIAASGAAFGLLAAAIVLEPRAEALAHGAPALEPTLRPAAIAVVAGGVVAAGEVAFACVMRGGVAGLSAAALTMTSAIVFAFAFFRGFFGLRRTPLREEREEPEEGEGEGKKTRKTKKKKTQRAAPVRAEVPEVDHATARLVAIVAAVGMVSAFVGAWLARADERGHAALGLVLGGAVAAGTAGALFRARGVATSPGFEKLVAREAKTELGRLAEGRGAETTASEPSGPGVAARLVLGLDAALAWPLSLVSRSALRGSRDEGGSE